MEVAFAGSRVEAGMIQGLLEDGGVPCLLRPVGVDGPLVGVGALPHSAQRVMVRADQAEAARGLLAGALDAGEEWDWPEFDDAEELGDRRGKGPRSYGLLGAYARIYFWSLCALGLAFAAFLVLRGG